MTKKCICEICTCGRHRCPHQPTNVIGRGDQPCLLSEYNNTYKEKPIQPRESFRPHQEPLKGGDFQDRTTQRTDFVPHPMEKPFVHQQEGYRRPDGDFDFKTSYTKEYTEKYGTPAKAIRNEGQRQIPGNFEGEPTYTSDYRKWDIDRQGPYQSQEKWAPPKERFEGQSTQKSDFRRYEQAPRTSYRPQEAAKLSDSPFEDRTDYRESYKQHALQPKFVRDREVYKNPGVPFEGLSTFQRDYQGALGSRGRSFKPDAQAYQSDQPLEDSTTQRKDYQPWNVQRPQLHQADPYRKPDGDTDFNTTHKIEYREHPLQKSVAHRPTSAAKARNADFDGTTNYMQDYRKWQPGQTQRVGPKNDYTPNEAPFEGLSTQKAHYIPHSLQPATSFKPDNAAYQSDKPFEDGTMYRNDYTPKRVQVCPATVIENPKSGYQFIETDPKGHKLYQPVYESITPLPRSPAKSPQRLQPLAVGY